MQKDLQEKIQKDPANQKKESTTPKRVSRTKSKTETPDERQFEVPENTPSPLPIDSTNKIPTLENKPR